MIMCVERDVNVNADAGLQNSSRFVQEYYTHKLPAVTRKGNLNGEKCVYETNKRKKVRKNASEKDGKKERGKKKYRQKDNRV